MYGLSFAQIVAGVVVIASCVRSDAESAQPLVTDRPDFTESAETVMRGRVQVESGYTYERADSELVQSFGEVLARVGVSERAELRIGMPSYLRARGNEETISGLDDAYLGAKFSLRKGEGSKPTIALIVGSTLPTGSRAVAERVWQPEAVLAASIDLSDKVGLSSNFGYARASSGGERFNQISGSVALGYSLNRQWGSYIEVFGFNREEQGGDLSAYVNGGFTYLIHNDFQLDARIGTALNDELDGYFWGVGASRRF